MDGKVDESGPEHDGDGGLRAKDQGPRQSSSGWLSRLLRRLRPANQPTRGKGRKKKTSPNIYPLH